MKLKHDVKYLTVTAAILLTMSSALSASPLTTTESEKEADVEMAILTIQAQPPAQSVETKDDVDIPKLSIDAPVEQDVSVDEEAKTIEDSTPRAPSEPMPLVQNKTNSYIPLLEGAMIFANLDDELPAVVNYYTVASEQEIIDFYQLSFGEVLSQERKRERLTLNFQVDNLSQRVIISEQNNKRQVDVIVE